MVELLRWLAGVSSILVVVGGGLCLGVASFCWHLWPWGYGLSAVFCGAAVVGAGAAYFAFVVGVFGYFYFALVCFSYDGACGAGVVCFHFGFSSFGCALRQTVMGMLVQ